VTSQKLMSLFTLNPTLGHITTFGGHPVSCAGALASLEVFQRDNIVENVENKGIYFEKLLKHPSIIEIRRFGLFFAIEMINADTVQKVVEGCKENGVLSFWFLSCPESFRIAPPLNISNSEIKESCKIINKVMDEVC
ncbi:MAG: aminotransferase class III-fold pyridoxal phosphate-dependent enzyme, partial [Flavobacteriales bacterium]|nr:aminotransferase class III-fold pyridoxal phosphate-dependent enzyme [Flavobacteriales bacterium]